jgi:hypothetical protein
MYKQRSKRTGAGKTLEQRRRYYEGRINGTRKVGKGYTGSKANKLRKDAPTQKADWYKAFVLQTNDTSSEYCDAAQGSKPNHKSRAVSIETVIRPDYLEMEKVKRRSMTDILNSVKSKFGAKVKTEHTTQEAKQG